MVVSRVGGRSSEYGSVDIHRFDGGREEEQEPGIFSGIVPGLQEVLSVIGGDGPVVVLSRSVHPGKGFFMEQGHQAVAEGYFFHSFHHQLVGIHRHGNRSVDRGQFVLMGSHFVVLGFSRNPQLPELEVQLLHEGGYRLFYGSEVVVVHFLTLGRKTSENRASGKLEVRSSIVVVLVDEEVFLLGTCGSDNTFCRGVSQGLEYPHGLPAQSLGRAEQGNLLVQSLPGVGDKSRGDTEGKIAALFLQESRAGGVPGCVSPGFKSYPQASRREG